jgi:hypothetical protein
VDGWGRAACVGGKNGRVVGRGLGSFGDANGMVRDQYAIAYFMGTELGGRAWRWASRVDVCARDRFTDVRLWTDRKCATRGGETCGEQTESESG